METTEFKDQNFGRGAGAADAGKDRSSDQDGMRAREGGTTVRDMAQAAASSLSAGAQDLARRAGEQASAVYEQSGRAGEYLTRNVNEYPAAALLIAGMVGYGIAYLIHGRSFSAPTNSAEAEGKQTRQDSRRQTRD